MISSCCRPRIQTKLSQMNQNSPCNIRVGRRANTRAHELLLPRAPPSSDVPLWHTAHPGCWSPTLRATCETGKKKVKDLSRLTQTFLKSYQISWNLLLIYELYYIVNEILVKQMYRNIKKISKWKHQFDHVVIWGDKLILTVMMVIRYRNWASQRVTCRLSRWLVLFCSTKCFSSSNRK